jgi:putative ABC transport system substrate-binding protein
MGRPIANITGFTNYEYDIGGKWLEMLKEIAPFVTRVLVIHNSANVSADGLIRAIQVASASSEAQVSTLDVRQHSEEKRSVDALVREARSGLIVLPDQCNLSRKHHFKCRASASKFPPHCSLAPTRWTQMSNNNTLNVGLQQR